MVHLLKNVIVLNQNFSHIADTLSSTLVFYLIKPCDFLSSIFPHSLGSKIYNIAPGNYFMQSILI